LTTEGLLGIPQAFCQECRLCCRFLEPDRQTPFSSRHDLRPILPGSFRGKTDPELLPVRVDEFELWQCNLLDESSWSCKTWPDHPLDCRIYPLLLVLHEGSPWLGIDTNCPYSPKIPKETLEQKAYEIRHSYWDKLGAFSKSALKAHLEKESTEGVIPILPLDG